MSLKGVFNFNFLQVNVLEHEFNTSHNIFSVVYRQITTPSHAVVTQPSVITYNNHILDFCQVEKDLQGVAPGYAAE